MTDSNDGSNDGYNDGMNDGSGGPDGPERVLFTDDDRGRTVAGIYTSTQYIQVGGGDHEDDPEMMFPMMELDIILASGASINVWVPVPLCVGIITACSHVIAAAFPTPTIDIDAVPNQFPAEWGDMMGMGDDSDDPRDPDRRHDDGN